MRRGLLLILLLSFLTACEKIEDKATPTPNQEAGQMAQTLFAAPTDIPATQTPAPGDATPANALEVELHRLVARLENAMLAGDYDTFMSYMSQRDPVLVADYVAWARDWTENPLRYVDLTVFNIEEVSPTEATARFTLLWSLAGRQGDGSSGGTTISALFYKEGDQWLFGGENWHSFDIENVRFYYFSDAMVENQPQADDVAEYLADVYFGVTREFNFAPDKMAHIKMYESGPMLQTMTRISIPLITRWNQPGESIKITLGPENTAPRETYIGQQYTRFVLYAMSGDQPDHYPWWVAEGTVQYGGSRFNTLSQRNRTIKNVAAVAVSTEEDAPQLYDWSALIQAPAAETPELAQLALDQAFTMIHYITETYGPEARNAWLQAIAGGTSLDKATESELGVKLADLQTQWHAWLLQQL